MQVYLIENESSQWCGYGEYMCYVATENKDLFHDVYSLLDAVASKFPKELEEAEEESHNKLYESLTEDISEHDEVDSDYYASHYVVHETTMEEAEADTLYIFEV